VTVAAMHPAYFALVMATGIVSIAAHLTGLRNIGIALFILNIAFYAGLWVLTGMRVARHRERMVADLFDHGRAVGFFTTVAGTCVLGSQFVVLGGSWRAGAALWFAGIVLWGLTTYDVLMVLTVKASKPALAQGINGGWLLPVVAAQSVSVLGTQRSSRWCHQNSRRRTGSTWVRWPFRPLRERCSCWPRQCRRCSPACCRS
jgi:tellurite resistance protein TehA-like permease